jgi:hypothetical protein
MNCRTYLEARRERAQRTVHRDATDLVEHADTSLGLRDAVRSHPKVSLAAGAAAGLAAGWFGGAVAGASIVRRALRSGARWAVLSIAREAASDPAGMAEPED